MKGLRDKEELTAEIAEDGAISVESHYVGRLQGFRFSPETQSDGVHGKAARHAAAQVLSRELGMRARRVAAAKADAFKLSRAGRVLWRDEEIATLEPAEDPLKPQVSILADEHLTAPDREKVQARLETWRDEIIAERLKPLVDIAKAEDVSGLARGIAFRLTESFGMLKRDQIADMMKHLDQEARAQLRKYGVRFGAFNIYFPSLLKPAPAELATTLWSLKNAQAHGLSADALPELPRAGLTSAPAHPATPEALYRVYGFHVCGPRAVRLDILERLADLIRPLLAWRAKPEDPALPPKGSTGDGGFVVTPEMMSILGCSPDELSHVLKALGFRLDRKTMPKPAEPAKEAVAPAASETAAAASETAPVAADAPAGDVSAVASDVATEAQPPAEADAASTATSSEASTPSDANTPNDTSAPVETSSPTETNAPAEAAAAPAADVIVIDIWRPRRRHEDRPPRRDGDRAGGREGHGQRRFNKGQGRRHGSGPNAGPSPQAAAPDSASAAAGAEGAPAPSQGQPSGGRHRDGGRDGGRDRPNRDGDRGNRRPHQQGRDGGGRQGGDRRRDDRRRPDDRQAPMMRSASPPPKKGGGIDPDSPFASLGALRDQLAKQAREKNPS